MSMKKRLWGYITEDEKVPVKVIPPIAKRHKLEKLENKQLTHTNSAVSIKIKNSIITQTIEVMKQTEMLQSLIETYSNKSGSNNYLLNPSQVIPQVDFHPENATDLVIKEKFAKPFSFIPPLKTDFSCGVPKVYPEINKEICWVALRKAICGHLRIAGFTDASDAAMSVFVDAIEEFIQSFLDQIRDIQSNNLVKIDSKIDIPTLEKAYFALYNTSIISIHNYFKNGLIARNRSEINEFKTVMQEYNKLMAESRKMQTQNFNDRDYLIDIEMSESKKNEVKDDVENNGDAVENVYQN